MHLQDNLTYVIEPEQIIDTQIKELRNKSIPLVKVVWKGLSPKENYLGNRGRDEEVVSYAV